MRLVRSHKKSNPLDDLWKEVREKVELGLELRRPYERQWLINMAFLAGNQYAVFNAAAHVLQKVPRQPGRVKSVDNILLPKWKKQVSSLLQARPKIAVLPNSNQEEDIMAAKLATKVAEWYYRDTLLKKKIRNIAIWKYTTGNAFLDDVWNPRKGPMAFDKKDGRFVYAGDVDSSVWSPFEIVVPAVYSDDDIQRLPWFIKRQRKQLGWFVENFKRGDEVCEEEITDTSTTVESMMTGLGGIGLGGMAHKLPSAYAVNMYMKPCKEYPKGLFLVAANGIVLEKSDYPFMEYSIEQFKDIEMPGVFWGDATISHAIGLQRSWNSDISSIEEFNRKIAKAKLRNPSGSGLSFDPDTGHGEVVTYKPVLGHKPEYMEIKGIGPTLDRNLDRIQFSLENLFSQHEVSRGTNRSDIRSGDMVELLLEQDASGTVPSHAVFEEGLERHLRRILERIQQGYTSERILKIGETVDDFEVVAFQGADLRGNKDIKVVKESSLPDSQAARQLQVERRYQMGLYGNPGDPRTQRSVLRMIDNAVVDDVFSGFKQDEGLAEWENRNMLQGQQMIANSYDNHTVHLEEHNRLRKSVKYHKARQANMQQWMKVDMLIELHCQLHTEFINEEIKKQIGMAMEAKNAKG